VSDVPATPILDLEQPAPEPPRSRRLYWLGGTIGLISTAIPILQDSGILPEWQLPASNTWLLLPILYIVIALHELGHAAAAKLVGIDMGGISVGPAYWQKSGTRWVFRWDWRRWGGGFFKPLTGAIGLDPAPFAWSVAGGPLASLLLTALSAIAWLRYGDGGWSWIGTVFWMTLLSFAITIFPFSSGIAKSDGARLWQFARHPEQARHVMALLGVQTEEAKGLRPREWNAELFETMMGIGETATEYSWCQLMAFYRNVDEGSDEAALESLERALVASARTGHLMRHALFLEAAFSSARVRKNAVNAREWRARAKKLRKSDLGAAADAAIAMCEGRYAEALDRWAAARARVDKLGLDSGLIRFAKAKWTELESECRLAKSATA
jgi:hypothetical protein